MSDHAPPAPPGGLSHHCDADRYRRDHQGQRRQPRGNNKTLSIVLKVCEHRSQQWKIHDVAIVGEAHIKEIDLLAVARFGAVLLVHVIVESAKNKIRVAAKFLS